MTESNDVRARLALGVLWAFLLTAFPISAGPAWYALPIDESQAPANVRDSAGVRIVESLRPAWPRGKDWLLSRQPSLTIGDIEGEEHEVLSVVVGAVRLS